MHERRVDLHTHTSCSDGKLSPGELVTKAHARGLAAISVTDHDSIEGYAEARSVGDRLGIEVIPGVELSVTVEDQEIHVLGYFIDPEHVGLNEHLNRFRRRRTERAGRIITLLNGMGLGVRLEDVLAQAQGGAVGRPHVAQALVARGLVPTYEDAFLHYLKDHGPAFVSKPQFPAVDAIGLLHAAGGVAVLAHPGARVDARTIDLLIDAGLDGIEAIHPSHGYLFVKRYQQLAFERGLLETGGSDYHGIRPEEDDNLIRYSIPYGRLDRIRRAVA